MTTQGISSLAVTNIEAIENKEQENITLKSEYKEALLITKELPKGEYMIRYSTNNDDYFSMYETKLLVYPTENTEIEPVYSYYLTDINSSSGFNLVSGSKTTLTPKTNIERLPDLEFTYLWEEFKDGKFNKLQESNSPSVEVVMPNHNVSYRVTINNNQGLQKTQITTLKTKDKVKQFNYSLNTTTYKPNQAITYHVKKENNDIGSYVYKVAYRSLKDSKNTIIKDYNDTPSKFKISKKGKYKITVYFKEQGSNKSIRKYKVIKIK